MCTVGRGRGLRGSLALQAGGLDEGVPGAVFRSPRWLGWGVQRCPLKEAQGTCSRFH